MPLKQKLSPLAKPFAYALIAISTISWTAVFVIPFLDFDALEIAGIITALIIIGEITFYLAILLLGKSVWLKIKHKFLSKLQDATETPASDKSPPSSK